MLNMEKKYEEQISFLKKNKNGEYTQIKIEMIGKRDNTQLVDVEEQFLFSVN